MAALPQRQQHPNQCIQKGRTAYPKLGEGQKEKHTQTHSHYLPHTQIQRSNENSLRSWQFSRDDPTALSEYERSEGRH